jgi:hypothetical protein
MLWEMAMRASDEEVGKPMTVRARLVPAPRRQGARALRQRIARGDGRLTIAPGRLPRIGCGQFARSFSAATAPDYLAGAIRESDLERFVDPSSALANRGYDRTRRYADHVGVVATGGGHCGIT